MTTRSAGKKNTGHLTAVTYYSGFDLAHDTYNALSSASDGRIYYVLSSESWDEAGRMYVYDPGDDRIEFLADLDEICGEKGTNTVTQGKSHVNFYERKGKLYFSTHVGVYETIDGMDRLPVNIPGGRKPYPGGHFLSYDLASGEFEDLAIMPDGEGVVTMTMDRKRGHIYGISWPTGAFIHYDTEAGRMNNLGLTAGRGEAGTPGDDFRSLCRSMFVDPRTGSVYYSTSEGDIFTYHPERGSIEKVRDADLRLDYFGSYDPSMPGSMGYNWRRMLWYEPEGVAYGVHGNSGYLFRFNPKTRSVELVERITSEPSRKSGMYDQFSYGYLGFELGPDGDTLYYLTGGPIYTEEGKRVKGADQIAKGGAKGLENLHLVTFNIPERRYIDHGPVFYEDGGRPTYVNSIAIDRDENVYTLARYDHGGTVIQDLVKIPGPFVSGE
ncbi:MAG: hypothetical protein WEC12_07100 [Balneolaceae bacterium]